MRINIVRGGAHTKGGEPKMEIRTPGVRVTRAFFGGVIAK